MNRVRMSAATAAVAFGLAAAVTGAAAPAAAQAGDPIRPLKLVAPPQAAVPQIYQATQLIAQEWRKLGLTVDIQVMPQDQRSDYIWYQRDKWDATLWQMVGRPERSDPDDIIFNLFHSSTAEKGYNFVGYKNAAYDKLAEQQRVETDPAKRKSLVMEMQGLLNQDQPYLFLVYPKLTFAFSKKVWDETSVVDQPGLGIKNFWTFDRIKPVGATKDLILNVSETPVAMNPLYVSGAADSWITELLWDRLLRIGPDGLPQPWAAESYAVVNPTTIEITLRDGMTWHDGKPVTVDDVVFSFTAPQSDKVPMYKPFVANIAKVEATGPRTVRFTLKQPAASFLTSTLAKVNLVPKHVWEPILADLATKPQNVESLAAPPAIGSGPFKFVRWKQSEEVVLERNPKHWAAPLVDRWILRIIPNAEATLGMLHLGEVNFLSDFHGDPQLLVDMAKRDPSLKVVESTDIGFQFVGFNERRSPFDDIAFRKALSQVINRTLIVEAAFGGFAVAANSPVSPALAFWHDPGTDKLATGLATAQKLLKDAGYTVSGGKLHYPAGKKETLAAN